VRERHTRQWLGIPSGDYLVSGFGLLQGQLIGNSDKTVDAGVKFVTSVSHSITILNRLK